MHKTYAQVCGFAELFFLSLYFFFFCSLSVLPPDLLFPRVVTQEFMAAPSPLSRGGSPGTSHKLRGSRPCPSPCPAAAEPGAGGTAGMQEPTPRSIPAGEDPAPAMRHRSRGCGAWGPPPAWARSPAELPRCRALACSAVRSSPVGWGGAAGAARAPRAESVVPRSRV